MVLPIVPDGWKIEHEPRHDQLIVTSPPPLSCFVTIDLTARGYRGGITSIGPLLGVPVRYRGRDWRQHLVNDAVLWLQGVTNPPKKRKGK